MFTSYRVHVRRRSQVKIDPPEGSPKVDFRMLQVLRSDQLANELLVWVYSPPMRLYVQDSHSSRSYQRTWSGAAPAK